MEKEHLKSILDGINESIYISDPLTHEMLYANEVLVNNFGSFSRKKCYKYLHNKSSPCSFCSNKDIFGQNLGKTHTREIRNRKNNRWYRCIDKAIKWPDGKMVRCEIAIDIDDVKEKGFELESYSSHLNELVIERTKNIRSLAELSMQLIGEQDAIFGNIIKSLGDMLSVKLICLSEPRDEKAHCLYLYKNGELINSLDVCEINYASFASLNRSNDFEIYNDLQSLFPESGFLEDSNAFSCCAIPCMNSKGEILAVLSIVDDKARNFSEEDRDIIRIIAQRIGKEMEREKIEKDLIKSEEGFRSIFENASIGMATVDTEGKFIKVNKALADMLGYEKNKLIGSPFLDIVALEDVGYIKDSCRDFVVGSDDSIQFERRLKTKKGEVIWVNVHVAAIKDDEGKVLRFIGQVNNITEKKVAEENLLKSEERYALIIEGASDGIWDRDLVTDQVYFSPRWKQMLGFNDEEFPNDINRFFEIIHPDDLEMVKSSIDDHLNGNSSHYFSEFRVRHKNGSFRWVLARGATRRDDAGKPVRFAGSHTDITDRKVMEEEILKGQRLESLGVLAGGIAHDFNNILTGVITNLEVAKDCLSDHEEVDEDVVQSLNYAESAALRAADLTRQLLTFSKGGAPVMKTVSVGELLVETASFVLRGTNVKRRCFIAEDLWNVKIDENQISQVVNNLVINAQQSMPDGGTVVIRVENVHIDNDNLLPLKPGKYIKVSIRDRGCGIPDENLLRIFDPYFTTKSKGTGLGLATSYTIVKRHMGHMTVESETALGTTFKVYLPASDEAPIHEDKRPESKCSGFARVLLLEDEDIVASSVNMIASSVGFELEHARDGKEAVKFYKRAMKNGRSFDVVMMDLTIAGGMGGVETIKRLKRIDPLIKAIVCSGYSDDAVMANYGEYGFCDVLPKPFTKDEVLEKWANLIKGNA